jgi:hypothetical protein
MRHRIGLAAQIHDRVRNAPRHIDECEVTEFPIGPMQTARKLRGELEHDSRALRGDLPESRIGHFRDLAFGARAYPSAARGLLVEQAHLAEELALVEIGKHHLVAVLVLDHDLDRAIDDVVENVGQVTRMDHHGLRRHGSHPAVA